MKTNFAIATAFTLGLAGCAVAPTPRPAPPQPAQLHQLLGGEWRIEDIAGAGVIDNSHTILEFLPDNQLAGSGGCNRLIGVYDTPAAGSITIDTSGSTRMACPKALMNQESKLLDLLPQITHYGVDNSGALQLTTSGGARITARR